MFAILDLRTHSRRAALPLHLPLLDVFHYMQRWGQSVRTTTANGNSTPKFSRQRCDLSPGLQFYAPLFRPGASEKWPRLCEEGYAVIDDAVGGELASEVAAGR